MSTPIQEPSSHPSAEPLLEFRDVMKIYGAGEGEVRALAGVSFQIHAGEFVAMMGPSGSGKSTTMNILGCLDTPTSGSYLFRGVDVGALSQKQRARLRRFYLGFVFQGFNLLARTNALENVELPLSIGDSNARNGGNARFRLWRPWACPSGGTTLPLSFQAASSSAWPSRAPWSRSPRFCLPMSRPAIWTAREARRSWNCFAASTGSAISPSPWSRTSPTWPPMQAGQFTSATDSFIPTQTITLTRGPG